MKAAIEICSIVGPVTGIRSEVSLSIGELLRCVSSENFFGEPVHFEIRSVLGEGHYTAMALEDSSGLRRGDVLESTGSSLRAAVGDALLGRMTDLYGNAMDGKGPITAAGCPIYQRAPSFSELSFRYEPLRTGIMAIDIMCPCLKGGKTGIVGGAGVGKTLLMTSVMTNLLDQLHDSVLVFAGVGERSAETLKIYHELSSQARDRFSMLISTMGDHPGKRARSLWSAITLAASFRDKGQHVIFAVDSIYRHIAAEAEIFGFAGQMPGPGGMQPTVYSELGRLHSYIESDFRGDITTLEAVYVPADDLSDQSMVTTFPFLDTAIVLDRDKAAKQQFPAIDFLKSSSAALKPEIVGERHCRLVCKIREIFQLTRDLETYISLWGSHELPEREKNMVDAAQKVSAYLSGRSHPASVSLEQSLADLSEILGI
ncbi:MAG: F0F1 ATP synthase subunit beta [Deltaproteobacteria bacterium]|nr:F0F1 ATP synthase subunit beta [Deltaproteobacteria bacterium]